jgi:phosphate transport system substrate-binding protein
MTPLRRPMLVFSLVTSTVACQGTPSTAPTSGAGPTSAQTAPTAAAANTLPIQIDGSSTVSPISEAVAEEFQKVNRDKRVTMGVSGTGGGFKKFCAGEIAVAGASRPIKPAEVEACAKAGIEYIELPVAYDGLTVVVNPQNTWAAGGMTVAELEKLWSPEAQGTVKTWADVRTGWPAEEIRLFGAGVDSGTYDYFTQAIVGKEHSSRGDYTSSEDDNVLVKGVSTDKLALGFFGFAYYEENKDKLKVVPIDDEKPENGAGPIAPSPTTIADATYQPLSRPIFIYVSRKAVDRPEVAAFVDFYLDRAAGLVSEVGYVALPQAVGALVKKRWADRKTGSIFGGHGSQVAVTLESLLSAPPRGARECGGARERGRLPTLSIRRWRRRDVGYHPA